MAPTAPESVRAFIAIGLEPGMIARLRGVQERLAAWLPEESVRWVRPEQLHLTLQFLGQVRNEQLNELAAALNRACAEVAMLQLTLEGLGCFPNTKHPRVIWIGIGGEVEPLQKLQKQIEQETKKYGNHSESRLFQPHLTIGRVNAAGAGARRVGEGVEQERLCSLGRWTVGQIDLIQSELGSQGPRYTTLATMNLAQ